MKKILLFLLLCLISLNPIYGATTHHVSGTSGYQLIIQNKNSVRVAQEKLIFDFSKERFENWSPLAELTSYYQLENISEVSQNVLLGYPYISTLQNLDTVPKLYVDQNMQISETLISDLPTQADNHTPIDLIILKDQLSVPYSSSIQGNVFSILPSSSSEEYLMNITFKLGSNTQILIDGLQSYSYDEKTKLVSLQVLVTKNQAFSFYTLKHDLKNLTATASLNDEFKTPLIDFKFETNLTNFGFQDYLLKQWDLYKKNYNDTRVNSSNTTAFIQKEVLDSLKKNGAITKLEYTFKQIYTKPRLMVEIFNIDLEKDAKKDIQIYHSVLGTLDSDDSKEPLYHYQYLTQLGWKESGHRIVEIIPSLQYPSIHSESLQLKYDRKSRLYSAKQSDIAINFNLTLSAQPIPQIVKNTLPSYLFWILGASIVFSFLLVAFNYGKHKKNN